MERLLCVSRDHCTCYVFAPRLRGTEIKQLQRQVGILFHFLYTTTAKISCMVLHVRKAGTNPFPPSGRGLWIGRETRGVTLPSAPSAH